jgi:molybdopterin-guanine dinucleotide biosynthesis protein A
MIDSSTVAMAVLAGGEGSRIGGGKPLTELGGRTLIQRAYDRARSWSSSATVAIRTPEQLGSCQLPWIADAAGIEGPLAGLAAALEWSCRLGAESLLTIPCDMPFLPHDLPRRLIDEIGEFGVALASSGGELHPVCGLWRNEAMYKFPDYCASGRRSLRGFAQHVGYAEVEWPLAARDPFFNINTPADLARAESMIGS